MHEQHVDFRKSGDVESDAEGPEVAQLVWKVFHELLGPGNAADQFSEARNLRSCISKHFVQLWRQSCRSVTSNSRLCSACGIRRHLRQNKHRN